jgi:hypothetical protein
VCVCVCTCVKMSRGVETWDGKTSSPRKGRTADVRKVSIACVCGVCCVLPEEVEDPKALDQHPKHRPPAQHCV